jgi:dynein heavy chain, axonemal
VLSAMGPPGGGRTFITPRCLRHFNILTYTELDEITIVQIFSSLTTFFLKKFNESVRDQIPNLISAVLHIYNTIRVEMLPTPSKSHYTFNLRDIWKVNDKKKKK